MINQQHEERGSYYTRSTSTGQRMGISPEPSEINGAEGAGRVNQENSERGNTLGTTINIEFGDSAIGKIFERVELLEQAFYSYVHAHQNRLETRLGESKHLEQQFTESIKSLKEEICDLAERESNKIKTELEADE